MSDQYPTDPTTTADPSDIWRGTSPNQELGLEALEEVVGGATQITGHELTHGGDSITAKKQP